MSQNKRKNVNDPCDYSKDAFLTNPVASVNDRTGMTPRVPYTGDQAKSYAQLLAVPSSAKDGAQRLSAEVEDKTE